MKRTHRHFKKIRIQKYPFTLVELMIVVSLIAVLSAMLLPALSSAKKKAHQISCTSIFRQLNIALVNYLNANDDKISIMTKRWALYCYPNNNGIDSEGHESYVLDAFGMKERSCLWQKATVPIAKLCPSLVRNAIAKGYVSYCTNTALCASKPPHLVFFNLYAMRFSDQAVDAVNNGDAYIHQMNKLKNPSVSAFWTEGMIQFQKKTNEGLFNSAGNPTNEPVYSHQGRNTVLHFDGHVSSVRHAMVLCPHFYPPDRGCPVCRFYHPYL